jgi:hypothetical protein
LKKILFLFGLIYSITACKNDLVTIDGWKDIPIIYGLLSVNDTATYIRVEKAFVDAQRKPEDIARIPDSLYYNDVTVTLIRTKNNERYTLSRVDGNTEGYTRTDGLFAKTPNYLYKIKNNTIQLKADDEYRIELLKKGQNTPFAKATTKVTGIFDIVVPLPSTALNLRYDNTLTVSMQTDEKSAKVLDVNIILNYEEFPLSNPSNIVTKKATWTMVANAARGNGTNGQPTPVLSFSRKGQEFFDYLGNNIPVSEQLGRRAKSIDVEILAAGQELIDFTSANIANSGITGSQTIPVFTNIENGRGIFSSRSVSSSKNYPLSTAMQDLLRNGDLTKKLNFR